MKTLYHGFSVLDKYTLSFFWDIPYTFPPQDIPYTLVYTLYLPSSGHTLPSSTGKIKIKILIELLRKTKKEAQIQLDRASSILFLLLTFVKIF
jgi:hypothetical protein